MNFKILKKSPIFTGVACILVLAFLAQAVLLVIKVLELNKAKRIYRSESAKLEELASFKYALTPEIRSEVFQNYKRLGEYWNQLVSSVAPTEYSLSAQDAEGVRLGVRYAKDGDYAKAIRRLIESKTGDKSIGIDPSAGFGFSNVTTELDAIKNIKDKKAQAVAFQRISQQGKLLEHTLRILIENNPKRIVSVRREVVVPVNSTNSVEDHPDFFVMPADVSLRTADIPTTAIQVTFVGYTDSLRGFMKQMVESYSKVPLIIRDVQVKPYAAGDSSSGASSAAAAPAEGGEPVVANNLSEMTVTLEYLEFTPIVIEEEEVSSPEGETETLSNENESPENGSGEVEGEEPSEDDSYNEEDEYSY